MFARLCLITCIFLVTACGNPGNPVNESQTYDYLTTFPKTGLSAGIKFNSPPKSKIDAPFTLRFWKTTGGNAQTGPFIDPGYPLVSSELQKPDEQDSIFLWMDSMGHGSKRVVSTRVVDGGGTFFKVSNVIFSMLGPWQIKLQLHQFQTDAAGKRMVVFAIDPVDAKRKAVIVESAQFEHDQKP